MAGPLERGHDAFDRQAWRDAFDALSAADDDAPLAPDDLERLAVAAYLVGEDAAADRAWERAHQGALDGDDVDRAVRDAVWLAITLILRGDMARAGGWLGRASSLVEEHGPEGSGAGYLLVPAALEALETGDSERAATLSDEAVDIARRHGDADLLAFALVIRGRALVIRGRIADGTRFLDEAMVSVTAGEVSPIPAGIIYCAVIEACDELYDVRRAAEWTEALTRWCEAQPDLVPYRGQCLVHRSQVLQLHGAWPDAVAEADRARARLAEPPHPALGLACYQRAELHRLRGEFRDAEQAYREASRHGHEPQPGLALLRLAEGKGDAAAASIRRAQEEAPAPGARARLLAAAVEILVATGDAEAARAPSDELAGLAAAVDAPVLHALSATAVGMLAAAGADPATALRPLRAAAARWRALEMPYECARARVLLGVACRALGDHDAATLEFEAARDTFAALGAVPDLERVEALDVDTGAAPGGDTPGGLTDRECEVLRLVAAGHTNRQIGEALVISEHTVARHVQNIFTKLGVSSRAAATAYAYEHELA